MNLPGVDPDRSVVIVVSAANALELQQIAFAGVAVRCAAAVTLEGELKIDTIENTDPRARAFVVLLSAQPRDLKALLEAGLYLIPKKPVTLSEKPTLAVSAPRAFWTDTPAPLEPVTWKELH